MLLPLSLSQKKKKKLLTLLNKGVLLKFLSLYRNISFNLTE